MVKSSPPNNWWNTNKEGVGPDAHEGDDNGLVGGQGELSVLGDHHVSLDSQCGDCYN